MDYNGISRSIACFNLLFPSLLYYLKLLDSVDCLEYLFDLYVPRIEFGLLFSLEPPNLFNI